MPSGGQISAGSGLQLQNSTPGIADSGNAHISGTFIANNEIYSLNTNSRLLKYGNNPGTNYNGAFAGGAGAVNGLFGQSNTITDGNVIQASNFFGNNNAIGNAAHVGITSWCVFGNNNTLFTSGDNGNVLACTVFGSNNQANKSNGVSNYGPIIFGYDNQFNNITPSSAYDPGVIIGVGYRMNGGYDNITLMGPLRGDTMPAASNLIKIGNSLQDNVTIGAYNLELGFAAVKFKQTANSTVSNTVAETSLVAAGMGSNVLAANSLNVGSTIRITARGTITDTGTPTLQIRVKIGATSFIDFGAVTFPTLVGTHGWKVEGEITIRTIGAGGTALGNGFFVVSVTGAPDADTLNTATTAINTTIANTVDMTAQWGTASASNTIICPNLILEVLG